MKADDSLLAVLRCPVDGQSLRAARAEERAAGAVVVTADGGWGYPEENGFPCLLPDRRLALRRGAVDDAAPRTAGAGAEGSTPQE